MAVDYWRLFRNMPRGFVIAVHDIPPARLAEFVEGMRPARPVPLSELVQRRKERKSCANLFAITVDDGVGDNVRALAQLCAERSWPATFYLPTRYLDSGAPMPFQLWWRLKPLLPRKKLQLRSGTVDLSHPGAVEGLSRKVERSWYCQRAEAYLPLTMELADAVTREAASASSHLQGPAPITWPEVTQLSRGDLIRFESHGVSHAAMSALSEEEIVYEMRHSQSVISEYTGRPCRHLCYPFGSRSSIGDLAPKVASRFYDSAVTMSLGSVHFADPWLLPRVPLYPANSLRFARLKVLLGCLAIASFKGFAQHTTPGGLVDTQPAPASSSGATQEYRGVKGYE